MDNAAVTVEADHLKIKPSDLAQALVIVVMEEILSLAAFQFTQNYPKSNNQAWLVLHDSVKFLVIKMLWLIWGK